jgi:SpoVK/Ycf46/Vps4 family AAA+-type ATPase
MIHFYFYLNEDVACPSHICSCFFTLSKTALRQAIEWPRTKRFAFERLGLVPPRGILLHGPPGCAKTTLARAAAGASAVAFLALSPAEVYASSYVGEAEAVVRRAFTLARSVAPCVLFFDEIDSILSGGGGSGGTSNDSNNHGMNRSGRGSSAEARVLSTFLNEMDGVDGTGGKDGVLVLGATNRPWAVDAALLRPGRLGDKIIYVPPPDMEARRSILELQSRHWKGRESLNLDALASQAISGQMTGAEIVGACREAAMRLLRDVTDDNMGNSKNNAGANKNGTRLVMKQEYLEAALGKVKPLLSNPEVLREFRIFDNARTTG